MTKCGKGCMPECEYFTTSGCVSPFNCPYRIEEINLNSVISISNKVYSIAEVNHLIAEEDKVIEKLKSENAILHKALELASEHCIHTDPTFWIEQAKNEMGEEGK